MIAALVVTIAATVLMLGLGETIRSEATERIVVERDEEAKGLLSDVESCAAFDDGVLDLSRAGAVKNVTELAVGSFSGCRVTVDLTLDGAQEIEIGGRGGIHDDVGEIISRSTPASIRTSSGMTAGVLTVMLWWE